MRLAPLPDDALGEYVGERFARSGRDVGDILEPLLATVRGHPQRAILLAHFLWERTPRGEECDAAGWGEGDELEIVDPLLELWIAGGRQGLAGAFDGAAA